MVIYNILTGTNLEEDKTILLGIFEDQIKKSVVDVQYTSRLSIEMIFKYLSSEEGSFKDLIVTLESAAALQKVNHVKKMKKEAKNKCFTDKEIQKEQNHINRNSRSFVLKIGDFILRFMRNHSEILKNQTKKLLSHQFPYVIQMEVVEKWLTADVRNQILQNITREDEFRLGLEVSYLITDKSKVNLCFNMIMKDFESFFQDSEYWFQRKMRIFNKEAIKRFQKYVQYYVSEENPFRGEFSRTQTIVAPEAPLAVATAVPPMEEEIVNKMPSTSSKRKNVPEISSEDSLRRSKRISLSCSSNNNIQNCIYGSSITTTKRRTSKTVVVNADKELLGLNRSVEAKNGSTMEYGEQPKFLNWFFPSSKSKPYHEVADLIFSLSNKQLIRNIQLNIAILQAKRKESVETLISDLLVSEGSRKEIDYVSKTFVKDLYSNDVEAEDEEDEEDEEEDEVDINEAWKDDEEECDENNLNEEFAGKYEEEEDKVDDVNVEEVDGNVEVHNENHLNVEFVNKYEEEEEEGDDGNEEEVDGNDDVYKENLKEAHDSTNDDEVIKTLKEEVNEEGEDMGEKHLKEDIIMRRKLLLDYLV